MSQHGALSLVLDAAEKIRDAAVGDLEGARRAHESACQQAHSLVDWRSEYQQRWQNQFKTAGGMEIMRCYQDFMLRLAEAVSAQDGRVEQARVYMEHCKAQLIERERKVAAVTQLMERRRAESLLKQNRLDQKATDEIAARTTRSSGGDGMGSSPLTSGFH